jgi:hypothetical protein
VESCEEWSGEESSGEDDVWGEENAARAQAEMVAASAVRRRAFAAALVPLDPRFGSCMLKPKLRARVEAAMATVRAGRAAGSGIDQRH